HHTPHRSARHAAGKQRHGNNSRTVLLNWIVISASHRIQWTTHPPRFRHSSFVIRHSSFVIRHSEFRPPMRPPPPPPPPLPPRRPRPRPLLRRHPRRRQSRYHHRPHPRRRRRFTHRRVETGLLLRRHPKPPVGRRPEPRPGRSQIRHAERHSLAPGRIRRQPR